MKKFIAVFLLILFCNPSWAAVDSKLVAKAEKYLNSITGLTGDFSQDANKKKDNGIFSMLRPGRVRLDYMSTPIQLISNGDDLFFYDKALDQITTIPLTSTPAGILVRKNINLTSSDIVVSETIQNKDTFSLDMHIKGNEGVGHMRVDFSNYPIGLVSWVVFDATGTTTSVSFSDLKTKTKFSKNYFQLQKHKTTSNSGGDSYYE